MEGRGGVILDSKIKSLSVVDSWRGHNHFRRRIVDMVVEGKDGHIPSAFSILEIISVLYREYLKFDSKNPAWEDRDYFVLSKGHGCLALYVNLAHHGFISENDLKMFCRPLGILGEHPDCTKVPGVEASTGSLGHGLPFALGLGLGLKIKKKINRVYVLVGDGECHEGTIWESAHMAKNLNLGNVCVIVDWNGSAAQLMPHDDLPAKWRAFGWSTQVIDGHDVSDIKKAFDQIQFSLEGSPQVIVAKTIKGKGVSMLEGHGSWHHRIPNNEEYRIIMQELADER